MKEMKKYTILVRVTKELQTEVEAGSAHAAGELAALECAAHGEICHTELSFGNVSQEEFLSEEAAAEAYNADVVTGAVN